jgi:hypothetical protein
VETETKELKRVVLAAQALPHPLQEHQSLVQVAVEAWDKPLVARGPLVVVTGEVQML